ncbi:MAG: DUF1722 domain-containing protein [Desulfobacterales bacterium]|nr:DUF1722 domain-containing protein [Desulfobacterales bacterium]MBF0396943.1 DUF1722 domain-containing protein [Desulfobacterales bacterium]
MRIWDISPGYLNRQSLLGEHRELHAIVSIIINNKKGYSKHPETLRWIDYGWALMQRHNLLKAEMSLRGFKDKSPVFMDYKISEWPLKYIDEPYIQFKILENKYKGREQGRIALPQNAQQFWSQHKYSVLARNVSTYKEIGKRVSKIKKKDNFSSLVKEVTKLLVIAPNIGGVRNALQHMWGYVSDYSKQDRKDLESLSLKTFLIKIQELAIANNKKYLLSSTALSELDAWI